jgi:hypothetical protein
LIGWIIRARMGVSILALASVSSPASLPPWWRVLSDFACFLGLASVSWWDVDLSRGDAFGVADIEC